MNSLFEIINGKKYKKCKDNEIRNPITLRCNKNKDKKVNVKKTSKELKNNDLFEIINGKKYKKCKDNEIRNPITLRCNKNKDKKVNVKKTSKELKNNDLFEIINGKKYKKCKDNEIRNHITLRCNKNKDKKVNVKKVSDKKVSYKKVSDKKVSDKKVSDKKVSDKKVSDKKVSDKKVISKKVISKKVISKKINVKKDNVSSNTKNKAAKLIQNKMREFLMPFINRVSANINDRISYYKNIVKFLEIDPKYKKYCLRFYKFDDKKQPIFRIGTNVILKNKIGSDSKMGVVYLSSFRDETKRLYKFATKISMNHFYTQKEIDILKKLTDIVIEKKCPHFPILYGSLECDNFNDYNENIKSSDSKLIIDESKNIKLPGFIKKNINKKFVSMLNELANGDLHNFIFKYYHNNNNLSNALTQIYITIMFFHYYTHFLHFDSHWGNFLYHKIKPGGFFHYKIFGKDYYIENIGFLWVIWDFGVSDNMKVETFIKEFDKEEYKRVLGFFLLKDKNGSGVLDIKSYKKSNKIINNLEDEYNNFLSKFTPDYKNKMNNMYSDLYTNFYKHIDLTKYNNNNIKINDFLKIIFTYILNSLVKNNLLLTNISKNSIIVNEKPYIIE